MIRDELSFTDIIYRKDRINHINVIRMENTKTIKISPKVYAELNAFTSILSERLARRVSLNDALEDLLSLAHKNKPSDFTGAWVMSDEEEEEIKDSLKELWRTWKRV
jgi:predicted CopG family antitoxin